MLTSWFYFSWRCLTPISDNLRLWGVPLECVIIGLEEITRCLKSDCYVPVFYLEMDVFTKTHSKASQGPPGGRVHHAHARNHKG